MSTFFGPNMTVIPGPTEQTLVALVPRVPLVGSLRGSRSASESVR
ncbi:hypothetical protein ABIB49_003671 [Arthrobacter sp. UYCu512]